MTIAEFVASAGVTMSAAKTDHNPHMDDSDYMDHWRCTLQRGRRRMALTYSKGYGHNGAMPEIGEVLDNLAMDASGYDNARTFAEWCAEYGYDTDSRKAEKTFNVVKREAARLRMLLGEEAYVTLLYKTDRE